MPIPIIPLRKNNGNAFPSRPIPKPYAQIARKSVAQVSRQKFASVPPISFAERWPLMTEIENKIVVRNAANTARTLGKPVQNFKEGNIDTCVNVNPRRLGWIALRGIVARFRS
jgi:hypothetical protein